MGQKKEGGLPVNCTEHAWSQKTSPVQRSPTGCVCLFVYDLETSALRVPRPTLGCCGTESIVRSKVPPRTDDEGPEGIRGIALLFL